MLLEVINIAASIINISAAFAVGCSILYLCLNYLKIKTKFHKIKMNPEELLQDISQDLSQDHINQKYEKQDIKENGYQPLLLVVVVNSIWAKNFKSQT